MTGIVSFALLGFLGAGPETYPLCSDFALTDANECLNKASVRSRTDAGNEGDLVLLSSGLEINMCWKYHCISCYDQLPFYIRKPWYSHRILKLEGII